MTLSKQPLLVHEVDQMHRIDYAGKPSPRLKGIAQREPVPLDAIAKSVDIHGIAAGQTVNQIKFFGSKHLFDRPGKTYDLQPGGTAPYGYAMGRDLIRQVIKTLPQGMNLMSLCR